MSVQNRFISRVGNPSLHANQTLGDGAVETGATARLGFAQLPMMRPRGERIGGWMEGGIDGLTAGRVDGRMDRWADGRMRVDGWLERVGLAQGR